MKTIFEANAFLLKPDGGIGITAVRILGVESYHG